MSKYLCLCGREFKRKKEANDHVKVYQDFDSAWPHQIMKKRWRGRFMDFFLDLPWKPFFKMIGALMILFTFEHHFNITLTFWEATFIGLGLGLYID